MRGREAAARRYAKALFSLAKGQGRTEAVGREIEALAEMFDRNPDLSEFLARPWTTGAAKREVVGVIAASLELSKLVRDFVALLAMRGRVDHLREIGGAYADFVDADLGRVRARVRTAVPLTDAERAALAARLSSRLGGAQVVLEEIVDRDLLGGLIVQVRSTLLDGSLDGHLARIRERLARG